MKRSRTTDQKELKDSNWVAYSELSRIFLEADPFQLIAAGAPTDEYSPEVATILAGLREARSVDDVQRIVHEVFVHWFGSDIAGPAYDYSALSKTIWAWSIRDSAPGRSQH